MSTRINGAESARAPRAIRTRLAAAIGLALLAIGLIIGRLQPDSDQRAASAPVASVAPSAATVPTLSWKDDYGTRHPDERP